MQLLQAQRVAAPSLARYNSSSRIGSSATARVSAARRTAGLGRRGLRPVRAAAAPEDEAVPRGEAGAPQLSTVDAIKSSVDNFFQRYDVVSAGMGSLVVTSVCVKNGQDPFTALWITAASTVAALVLHELWFGEQQQQ